MSRGFFRCKLAVGGWEVVFLWAFDAWVLFCNFAVGFAFLGIDIIKAMKWIRRFFVFLIILSVLGFLGSLLARLPVGERVAVLRIEGVLVNSEPIVRKIERLKEDKSVRALVVRAESPGGSVGSSQEIYRAL